MYTGMYNDIGKICVQLYKEEIFATEESKRSLHFEQGKAKTTDTVRIFIFSRATASLPV